MLFYLLSVLSIAICGLFSNAEFNLPASTCKRNSDDYSTCLKRYLENMWPQFIAGISDLDFGPIDPLFSKYNKMVINSDMIHAEVTFSNLTAVGLSKTRFTDIRPDFLDDNVFHLEIDAQVPRIFTEAIVKIDGSINVFRLVNAGYLNLTTDDMRGTCDITGHVVNDTWIIESFRLAPSIGKFKTYFDNTIEGNKEINDLVVTFINEFWPLIYRGALPFISDAANPRLSGISNRFFSKVPFSKVFP